MVTIEDKVRAKRAQIAEQRDAVLKQMEMLDSLKRRLATLEEQAAMLDDLLVNNGENSTPAVVIHEEVVPPQVIRRLNPTDGVLDLLSKRPEGMKLSDIVDALNGRILTASDNPRSVVRNTILNLVNRNRLVRNDDGLIFDPKAKV
jgi:hypothetical protein